MSDVGISQGKVTSFDEHVGLGVIECNNEQIPFHCINIADGSRSIEIGTQVTFEKYDHPRGREEARNISKLHHS